MKLKHMCYAVGAAFASLNDRLIPVPHRFGQSGAIVTVKSSQITNGDATPVRINPAYTAASRIIERVGVLAFANGDSATSVYRFTRIRSIDRVSEIVLDCDALGAACSISVGLHDVNGGAVVSAALFMAATVLAAAQVKLNALSAVLPANREKRVFELLGLAADPQKEYDVTITVVVATAAAGSIALQVRTAQN